MLKIRNVNMGISNSKLGGVVWYNMIKNLN